MFSYVCPEPVSMRVHLWWPTWPWSQLSMQSPLTLAGSLLSLNGILAWRQPEQCRCKGKMHGLGLQPHPTALPPQKSQKRLFERENHSWIKSVFSSTKAQVSFLNFLFCIGVEPVNSVVKISGEQQRDPAIHLWVFVLQTPLSSRLPYNIEQSSTYWTVGKEGLSFWYQSRRYFSVLPVHKTLF